MALQKATKEQSKLRMALHGPSGSGKTYTALRIATGLGQKIALLDTERKSACKYADRFSFDFDECVDDYNPEKLIAFLRSVPSEYDVVVIDSLTHFWNGIGGFLDLVDQEVKNMRGRGHKPDSFAAWKTVTPVYNRMIQAILAVPAHVIVTMRAKMEYAKEQDEKGKTSVKRVGLAPEMRDNFQYEFDVEGMLNLDHDLLIGKTRFDALDGKVVNKPTEAFGEHLKKLVSEGAAPAALPAMPVAIADPPQQNDKVQKCLERIAGCSNREEYEALGVTISKTPDWFQKEVLAAYEAKGVELG